MASRKDNKGRVLKSGESQRKDGTYQYRYTNPMGKRCYEYATTLQTLRIKEEAIQNALQNGLCFGESKITLNQLFQRFIAMKQGQVRGSSLCTYQTIQKLIQRYPIGNIAIAKIKQTDIKVWLFDLIGEGYAQKYVSTIKCILHGVFEHAVSECLLASNPCHFRLAFGSQKEESHKYALTLDQQKQFLSHTASLPKTCHLVPLFTVLLGTGMRISEAIGLTKDSVDFDANRIQIDHQLSYQHEAKGLAVTQPKSNKSNRLIPMTADVRASLKQMFEIRSFIGSNPMIDGYQNFLFVHPRNGQPYGHGYIRSKINQVVDSYNKLNPSSPLPPITPHIFRHTFTSNLLAAGVPPKTVQYLLGHSDITTTMNIYAHISQDYLESEIKAAEKYLKEAT